jgi:hypothetical protein
MNNTAFSAGSGRSREPIMPGGHAAAVEAAPQQAGPEPFTMAAA